MIKLVIRDDDGRSTIVPILRDEITIGRREGNTIRLTERNVSRDHARLSRVNTSILIEDLDSYSGVRVNGTRIQSKTVIREGDLVQIGDYQLVLEADTSEVVPPGGGRDVATVRIRNPDSSETSKFDAAEVEAAASQRPAGESDIGTNWAPPRLVGLTPPVDGKMFPLSKSENVIGRVADNDIVIDDKALSRHHIKIMSVGGRWKVLDLGSTTGFCLNGEEFETAELRQGDEIALGSVKLRFEWPPEKQPDAAASASATPTEAAGMAGSNGSKGALPSTAKLRGLGDVSKEAPRGTKVVVLGAIGVAFACVVALVMVFSGDKPAARAPTAEPHPTRDDVRGASALAPAAASRAEATPATLTPSEADDRQSKLTLAKSEMEAERWESAVRILYPWVKAHGDDKEVRTVYDEARREDAASRTFQLLKTAFGRESWGEFVLLAKRIPDNSRYRREMMIFVGKLYERAEAAAAAGANDRAMMFVQQILRADPTNEPARRLLADIGRRFDARAAARVGAGEEKKNATTEFREQSAERPVASRHERNGEPDGTGGRPPPQPQSRGSGETQRGKGTEDRRAGAREEQAVGVGKKIAALEKEGLNALWNDPSSAIDKFNAVLKLDANRAVTHRLLGVAYANLEKRELAIHYYKRYLVLAPDARDRPSVERALEKLEQR